MSKTETQNQAKEKEALFAECESALKENIFSYRAFTNFVSSLAMLAGEGDSTKVAGRVVSSRYRANIQKDGEEAEVEYSRGIDYGNKPVTDELSVLGWEIILKNEEGPIAEEKIRLQTGWHQSHYTLKIRDSLIGPARFERYISPGDYDSLRSASKKVWDIYLKSLQ